MQRAATAQASARSPACGPRWHLVLRIGFTVLPILMRADKFLNAMTSWDEYLAPMLPRAIAVTPELFMRGVGAIEIVTGVLAALVPRYAACVVMAWLWLIIGNLVRKGEHWDVALRDFGLSVAAFALACLATSVHRSHVSR